MALKRLTQNSSLYDLTSSVQVLDFTPDTVNPRYLKLLLQVGDAINGLNNGGDLALDIWIGGISLDGKSQIKTVTTGITKVVFLSNELIVPAGDDVEIYVSSSDSADTNVRVIVEAYDIPTGNLLHISDDETAADNLKNYCNGTTAQPVNATQISGSTTAADNAETVFDTDFANAYSTTNNRWDVNTAAIADAVPNNISATEVNAQCDQALADAGVNATRMAYVDNLNIGENVAGTSEVTSITNNTRCVRVVPCTIERPDSGSTVYRVELLLYDESGNMESPDAAPTVNLVDESGESRTARLDSTTMSLISTGRYRTIYTATSNDEIEQLIWAFSVVESGVTRIYGNTSLVVDTTAVDFTSADRSKLDTIFGKLPSKSYLCGSADADGGIDTTESEAISTAVWDRPQTSHTADGSFGSYLDTRVSGISSGSSTSVLPWAVRLFRDGSASTANLTAYQNANLSVSLDLVDADNQPVNLSGVDLLFVVWQQDSPTTSIVTLKNYDGQTDITVSGDDNNRVTIFGGAAQLTTVGRLVWCLRNKTSETVVADGTLNVREAASG